MLEKCILGQGRIFVGKRNDNGTVESLELIGDYSELTLDTLQSHQGHNQSFEKYKEEKRKYLSELSELS